MPSSKKFTAAAIVAVATMSVFAVSTSVPAAAHSDMAKSQPNIVETAQSTGVHNTLVAAVQAAGLQGLNDGQKISYELQEERGKTAAANLKVV